MTKEQTVIDGFHTRVISLMLRRAKAQRFNDWPEEEKLTKEIERIEDERRAYERQQESQREEKSKVSRSVSGEEAGTEQPATKTGI